MIILDTNVLSAIMQKTPERCVVVWLDSQPRSSIWTTSISILEIRFGLALLPEGKRRSQLTEAFNATLERIDHRVAPFDQDSALQAGVLMAERQKRGRPVDLRDTMIAGIVITHRAALATRNTAHFSDLSVLVVNPWSTSSNP